MTIIETVHLKKTYDEQGTIPVHAINDINLRIEKGEFTAIVGPSGSGKTTLLNTIGGLDYPSAGKVLIDDHDISEMTENQLINFRLRNIGFVFQAYNLIPVLTAKENVSFVMLLQKKSKQEREQRTIALLNEVGLSDRINSRPAELSGGQQQRVAVARALASHPKFILADEPTANLDSRATSNLLDIMAKLNQEEQITFIFSTHDIRVIERARRVITIEDGKISSDIQQQQNEQHSK